MIDRCAHWRVGCFMCGWSTTGQTRQRCPTCGGQALIDCRGKLVTPGPRTFWEVARACPECGGRGWTDLTYEEECPTCATKGYVISQEEV